MSIMERLRQRNGREDVELGIADTVADQFGRKSVRPRDINKIADDIDACDAQEKELEHQLHEIHERRHFLRLELRDCCDGIVDQAQRIRERYIGDTNANICGNDDVTQRLVAEFAERIPGSGQASPIDLSDDESSQAGVPRQEAEVSADRQ